MKRMLSMVMLLGVITTMTAQVQFTVKGVAHPDSKQVTWGNIINGTQQAMMADVVDGKFTFTGEGAQGDIFTVIDQEYHMQSFFIVDAKEITVDMNTDVMTGGELNTRLTEAMKIIAQSEETGDTNASIQLLEKNKDNAVGALVLFMTRYELSYNQLKTIVESNEPYVKHPINRGLERMLKALEKRQPGQPFKDLEENDVDGVAHKLSEFLGHGNYVLVDFWASWCGPCMQEMPNLKANYEKYHPKGFEVVGLSLDRNADAWKNCIEKNGLNWIHLSDLKFWQSVAASTYGINSIPSSILVDPDGMIVDVDLRGPKLGATLARIYGE